MAKRIARFGLDPGRIGVRDPDEDLVGGPGRTLEVLEVAAMERLEAPVDHPAPNAGHCTTTPEPSSTTPMRRRKIRRAVNSASSVTARSAGTAASSPPAVCGS